MIFYGKRIYTLLKEVKAMAKKSQSQIDVIVGLAGDLILHNRDLVEALREANVRAQAAAEELALFKSNDAAEDALQLAQADEEIATYAERKAAELRAQIEAQGGGAKSDPVPVPADEPSADEPGNVDAVKGVDDAQVVVLEPGDVAVVPKDEDDEEDLSRFDDRF